MERILSKEEIAELLAAVREGGISTEISGDEAAGEKEFQNLDLLRLPGRERWKIPNLDLIFESFGRNYGFSLTNRLRRTVNVQFTGIETQNYDPFIQGIHEFSAIGVLRVDPLKSAVLLVVDGDLGQAMVELMLGGTPDGRPIALTRPMTTIEIHLISGLMEDSCSDLAKAFRPVQEVFSSLMKVEKNPRLVNIAKADAGMLIARFKVKIDKMGSAIALAIPYSALEPLKDKFRDNLFALANQGQEDWSGRLYEDLQDVATTVTARLSEVTLTARDLLNFQTGDVITLDVHPDDPLEILVEEKVKYKAVLGVNRGKKAVRITERI